MSTSSESILPQGILSYAVGGGTVPEGCFYIEREADQELLQACLALEYAHVLTARQMGKSSLITRVAKSLQRQGVHIVLHNASRGIKGATAAQWCNSFARAVNTSLESAVQYRAVADDNTALENLEDFLEVQLLTHFAGPIVLFLDEIDSLAAAPFGPDFLSLVRNLYNRRAENGELNRLSFVLVGTMLREHLIVDPNRAPFDIGRAIKLRPFTSLQAEPLADGLPFNGKEDRRAALDHVLYWTDGQPRLTIAILATLAGEPSPDPRDSRRRIDAIVDRILSGDDQQLDVHLARIRNMLAGAEFSQARPPRTLEVYQELLRGKKIKENAEEPTHKWLSLSGVARSERGYLRIANQIYRRVFHENWVKEHVGLRQQVRAWFRRYGATLAVAALFAAGFATIYAAYLRNSIFAVKSDLGRLISVQRQTESQNEELLKLGSQYRRDNERGLAENKDLAQRLSNGLASEERIRLAKGKISLWYLDLISRETERTGNFDLALYAAMHFAKLSRSHWGKERLLSLMERIRPAYLVGTFDDGLEKDGATEVQDMEWVPGSDRIAILQSVMTMGSEGGLNPLVHSGESLLLIVDVMKRTLVTSLRLPVRGQNIAVTKDEVVLLGETLNSNEEPKLLRVNLLTHNVQTVALRDASCAKLSPHKGLGISPDGSVITSFCDSGRGRYKLVAWTAEGKYLRLIENARAQRWDTLENVCAVVVDDGIRVFNSKQPRVLTLGRAFAEVPDEIGWMQTSPEPIFMGRFGRTLQQVNLDGQKTYPEFWHENPSDVGEEKLWAIASHTQKIAAMRSNGQLVAGKSHGAIGDWAALSVPWGHRNEKCKLRWDSAGERLAGVCNDTLAIWNPGNAPSHLNSNQFLAQGSDLMNAIPRWSPNGRYIALFTNDKVQVLERVGEHFEIAKTAEMRKIGINPHIRAVRWSNDSRRLVVGGDRLGVSVLTMESPNLVQELQRIGPAGLRLIGLLKGGGQVAAIQEATADGPRNAGNLIIYDLDRLSEVERISGCPFVPASATDSPDGKYVAVTSLSGICVYSRSARKVIWSRNLPSPLTLFRWSEDASKIAGLLLNEELQVWWVTDGTPARRDWVSMSNLPERGWIDADGFDNNHHDESPVDGLLVRSGVFGTHVFKHDLNEIIKDACKSFFATTDPSSVSRLAWSVVAEDGPICGKVNQP